MKKERKVLLFATIIILIGISISLILEKNMVVKSNKQTIKEMSESTQVEELNNQINSLNAEHTAYMNYIQTCKNKIATALTNEGIETSSEETLETMAENISKIFTERTKLDNDVAATADNITEGKQAWVNGKLINGNKNENLNIENFYNLMSWNYSSGNWYSKTYTQTNNYKGYLAISYCKGSVGTLFNVNNGSIIFISDILEMQGTSYSAKIAYIVPDDNCTITISGYSGFLFGIN